MLLKLTKASLYIEIFLVVANHVYPKRASMAFNRAKHIFKCIICVLGNVNISQFKCISYIHRHMKTDDTRHVGFLSATAQDRSLPLVGDSH